MVGRQEFVDLASERLLFNDLDLIDTHGTGADVFSLLATEHAARTQALLRCCPDQTLARNLLVIIAGQLTADAKAFSDAG